jgi:hypothetical protein
MALHQGLLPPSDMTLCAIRSHGIYVQPIGENMREFHMYEVVCKRKEQFAATMTLEFIFSEDEREDDSQQERIDLPEHLAENFFGVWVTRFYVLCFENGSIALFDTMPNTQKITPEFLNSLVLPAPPFNNVVWKPSSSDGNYSIVHIAYHCSYGCVHGFEDATPRVTLHLGSRPVDSKR